MSFSTDLREKDVIFGGEKKLAAALDELIDHIPAQGRLCLLHLHRRHHRRRCGRRLPEGWKKKKGIPVLPVHSEGFKGTKKDGYKAACDALFKLVGTGSTADIAPVSINILGEFNIGGEAWLIKKYYEEMGIQVVSIMTGDGRVDQIRRSHGAALNVVQCSGALTFLAEMMQETYGIPYIRASYFGIDDMAKALYDVADHFDAHPADHGPHP